MMAIRIRKPADSDPAADSPERFSEIFFETECARPKCRRAVDPGRRYCIDHTTTLVGVGSGRGYWSHRQTRELTERTKPLPDWMLDPSLLPKRPPGRA